MWFSTHRNIQNTIYNSFNSIITLLNNHIFFYPTPINFSYIYSFGALIGIVFVIQIITGIILAMHYTCSVSNAFNSVVYIMTDVEFGYIFRYLHANGASLIFIGLYIHMARGLYYRSYLHNRTKLWASGIIIFLLMMGTAFIGYVLPWGQMSFWGATVITSLVTAIPLVGEVTANWIWGGFSINNATLTRFFSIHFFLPFVIFGFLAIHLSLLHDVTSTNPKQLDPISAKITFHPYYTLKDFFAFTLVLILFLVLINFLPNILGHSDNFILANALVTPAHIVPEWYFTPFYAILRSCPNKLGGVISMISSICILFLLPIFAFAFKLVPGPISILHKIYFYFFIGIFFCLLNLGGKPATTPYVFASKFCTIIYFFYFLIITPGISWFESVFLQKNT